MRPPAVTFKLPETDERLTNTMQLAYCIASLRAPQPFDDPLTQNWLQTTGTDTNEQGRLILIATEMIRAFKRDGLEDAKAVAEVACLAPVLEKDDFRHLLKELYLGVEQPSLLDIHQLRGLAQSIQGVNQGYLDTDDLVKVLDVMADPEVMEASMNLLHLIWTS
ncbi:MAG: hypothetical protein J3Q66DRAFT_403462 [Benniella sp.]|nr:MAG: hypothetical protein J3Q66DRAFT_403462 [Benniella sp.]